MRFILRGLHWQLRWDHPDEWLSSKDDYVRRAWWRLWHRKPGIEYCFRLLGLTLHGRKAPWRKL